MATLTPALCQLMNREQNDDTFLQLVRMKGGGVSNNSNNSNNANNSNNSNSNSNNSELAVASVDSPHKKRKRGGGAPSLPSLPSHVSSVRFAGLVHAAMNSVDVSDDLLMDMIRYVHVGSLCNFQYHTMKRQARVTLNVEFIRACIFIFLLYV